MLTILFRFVLRVFVVGVMSLVVVSCGNNSGRSPTAPSQSPSPPPIPSANLQSAGQGSWISCTSRSRLGCYWSGSLQNVGSGCASGTTAIVRFFDGNDQQLGSDVQVGAAGGLSSLTIRSQEIVALTSTRLVAWDIVDGAETFLLSPTWNNVEC